MRDRDFGEELRSPLVMMDVSSTTILNRGVHGYRFRFISACHGLGLEGVIALEVEGVNS